MDATYRAALLESRKKLFLNRMDHDLFLSNQEPRDRDPDRNPVDLSKDHDPPVENFENFYKQLVREGNIFGKYRELFAKDPTILKAGEWRVPPWVITAALNRKGLSWVRRQIDFVAANPRAKNKNRYLCAVLARNDF